MNIHHVCSLLLISTSFVIHASNPSLRVPLLDGPEKFMARSLLARSVKPPSPPSHSTSSCVYPDLQPGQTSSDTSSSQYQLMNSAHPESVMLSLPQESQSSSSSAVSTSNLIEQARRKTAIPEMKDRVAEKLQPAADYIWLNKDVVRSKLAKEFPGLKPFYINALDNEAAKTRHIRYVAQALIKHDEEVKEVVGTIQDQECQAYALELEQQATKNKRLFIRGTPKLSLRMKQAVDDTPLDPEDREWAQLYSTLDDNWKTMAQTMQPQEVAQKHKEQSFVLMKQIFQKFHPNVQPSEKDLKTNYEIFEKGQKAKS